jgi:hypothetical protein
MSVYSFTADNVATIHGSKGQIIVEIMPMDYTTWTDDLPALDWTASKVEADRLFPFGGTEINVGGDNDAGEVVMRSFSLEASNRYFDSNLNRMSDVMRFNPYEQVLHCRMGYTHDPSVSSVSWVYGLIDYNSISYKMDNIADPDTWYIKFDVADYCKMLSDRSLTSWMEYNLKHVDYDVSGSNVYLSYATSNLSVGAPIGAGRTRINSMLMYDTNNEPIAVGSGDDKKVYYVGPDKWRFMRIIDIFQSVHDSLGCEAPINNGVAWTDMVTTTWVYNDANYVGTDVFNFVEYGIDHLYLKSGDFYPSPNLSNWNYWKNNWTVLDYDELTEASLLRKGNTLEAIKFILISLGLTMSVKMNTAGQRYLEVKEIGFSTKSLTASLDSTLISGSCEIRPYADVIDGLKIYTVFKTEYMLGGVGNNVIAMDTLFVAGQNIVRKHLNNYFIENSGESTHKGYGSYRTSSPTWIVDIDRGDKEMYQTLFISPNNPTTNTGYPTAGSSSAVTDMYTVCNIIPRRGGVTMPSTVFSSTHRVMGVYVTTGMTPLTINGVVFPWYGDSGTNWENIHSMWLASYYYSVVSYDDDPTGLQRKYSRDIELEYPTVLPQLEIGQQLALTINGNVTMWRLKEMTVDLNNFTTKFVLTSMNYTV